MLRKRLRKSSTGSGSGSTEKTSDECPPSDVTLTSPGGNITTVIKPDPGGSQTDSRCKQIHAEIEVQRGSSHESIDSDTTQQITLVSLIHFTENFIQLRFLFQL